MKLSKLKVRAIKNLLSVGLSQPEIAKQYHVGRSVISDIATGRVHKDVPWPAGEPCPKRAGGQRKPLYDPTNERVMELEAEVVHLTEERNRERTKVKAGAKLAGLFKAITKEMDVRIKPFPVCPSAPRTPAKGKIVEDCVLHLSDGHHDQVVRPEAVGGLEQYDFPISCAAPSGTWTRFSTGPSGRWPPPFAFRTCGCWPTGTTPAEKSTRRASGRTIATSLRTVWPSVSCTP